MGVELGHLFKIFSSLSFLMSLSETHTANSDGRSSHDISSPEQVLPSHWVQGTFIEQSDVRHKPHVSELISKLILEESSQDLQHLSSEIHLGEED